jgi:hypothetical protein
VDAVAILLVGIGGYLMYAAYKNEHPWTYLTTTVLPGIASGSSGPTTTSLSAPTTNAAGQTIPSQLTGHAPAAG